MSGKKIEFSTKPTAKPVQAADAWVSDRQSVESEPMKRLTIDISESLHRTIKAKCAMRGTKIADEVRELLIKNYID